MINKKHVVLLPNFDLHKKQYLEKNINNVITINTQEKNDKGAITKLLNESKIQKLYLYGNCDLFTYFLQRKRHSLEVVWIFDASFSSFSNPNTRFLFHYIQEFMDRKLVESIGCFDPSTYSVLTNAGIHCELLKSKMVYRNRPFKKSNSIGILSNDFDPNNNFYNQLAALTLIEQPKCKLLISMGATTDFLNRFNIKYQKCDSVDEVIRSNFVNLYINFTNTDKELIKKSFSLGIPCIVGNCNLFDKNKYLKENIVVKSDDDINEIAEKINFAKQNRERIILEYNKLAEE